jgi:MFS transporter, ACS family, allantoate permease
MSDIEKDAEKHFLDPGVEKDLPEPLAEAIKQGQVPDKILQHSHDADEALKAFASMEGQVIHLDEATSKRILRKIDFNLIPVQKL